MIISSKIIISSVTGGLITGFYNLGYLQNISSFIYGFGTGFIVTFISVYLTYKILFKEVKK